MEIPVYLLLRFCKLTVNDLNLCFLFKVQKPERESRSEHCELAFLLPFNWFSAFQFDLFLFFCVKCFIFV